MNTKKLLIEGMHCSACVKLIQDEFKSIKGIEKVDINLEKKEADIFYTSDDIDLKKMADLIEPYGYKIIDSKNLKKKN